MPTKIPDSVTNLIKSTRYVHLATCLDNTPHISLMNYTYYKDGEEDLIIISTPKGTTKYKNMIGNPQVSLLIHDWISAKTTDESGSPKRRNSLYELLMDLNKSETSRVSVMLTGKAELLTPDSPRYGFFRSMHLNNCFIDQTQAKNYIESDKNALFIIHILHCKITDTEDNIEEY